MGFSVHSPVVVRVEDAVRAAALGVGVLFPLGLGARVGLSGGRQVLLWERRAIVHLDLELALQQRIEESLAREVCAQEYVRDAELHVARGHYALFSAHVDPRAGLAHVAASLLDARKMVREPHWLAKVVQLRNGSRLVGQALAAADVDHDGVQGAR